MLVGALAAAWLTCVSGSPKRVAELLSMAAAEEPAGPEGEEGGKRVAWHANASALMICDATRPTHPTELFFPPYAQASASSLQLR